MDVVDRDILTSPQNVGDNCVIEGNIGRAEGRLCPLMTEDLIGGVTCLYRLEEVGACMWWRCPYFQELSQRRARHV